MTQQQTNRADRLVAQVPEFTGDDLKFMVEVFGIEEDEARARRTLAAGEDLGIFCGSCRHEFEDGDVVYRRKLARRDGPFAYGGAPLRSFCHDCASEWHPSWLEQALEAKPCAGDCGVLVSSWYRRFNYERREYEPTITTCSPSCSKRVQSARRRVEHEPKVCEVCGETFTPRRSDAKTCSDRCRQAKRRRS